MIEQDIFTNELHHVDSLEGMRRMKAQGLKVELIVTDPPYEIGNFKPGGNSGLSKSIAPAFYALEQYSLRRTVGREYLEAMMKLQDKINIYIFCNAKQIPFYLKYFVEELKCKFDILVWHKTNAMPLFSNKYLTDKEYILYFKKGGYCQPEAYTDASTVYTAPINAKDKLKYLHPTIKPLPLIEKLIRNSSRPGDIVLDPFCGSGTTAVAAKRLGRRYISFEIERKWYDIGKRRIAETVPQGAI